MLKIMDSGDAMMKVCSALDLGPAKSTVLLSMYGIDKDRFDANPDELKQWFIAIIGSNRGPLAFDVYESVKSQNT